MISLLTLSLSVLPSVSACRPSVPFISAEELKQQVDGGYMISIIDVRRQDEYDIDHIKGSLSMPYLNITSGRWQPPKDSGWVFVLYCA